MMIETSLLTLVLANVYFLFNAHQISNESFFRYSNTNKILNITELTILKFRAYKANGFTQQAVSYSDSLVLTTTLVY